VKHLLAAAVIAVLATPPGRDAVSAGTAPAPILVELRTESAGRQQVDLIDVWKNPSAGARGGLRGDR
jgi:hypothetical protein